ncbi:signal transduction histidine kinase [Breznakibacter xylanolyticus]|uniref:histidine kinase n=2 Tax=Breznakibacter xylanolyticus TaxID=990 RepID=A0A2W7NI75_9BACT|nr:signal transduction histidine kinase [Breznakibacter xylanolyticus]
MHKLSVCVITFLLIHVAYGQGIFRFEHYNTQNGLSQNTVFSVHCDPKGFLWIGTMNGLNRFDGYDFKIYKSIGSQPNMITNNRVSRIWDDARGFIWMESYDGYYHFFNPKNETFNTLPRYSAFEEEQNSKGTCFLQYTPNEVWMGASNSGVYRLQYQEANDTYSITQFLSRGTNAISNNKVSLIHADSDNNLWIGTIRGINFLSKTDIENQNMNFQHLNVDIEFTGAVAENNTEIWFGTRQNGILCYNKQNHAFWFRNASNSHPALSMPVTHLVAKDNRFWVGTAGMGLVNVNPETNQWISVPFHDQTVLDLYADRHHQMWVTGNLFGITRVETATMQTHYYELTPKDNLYATDLERHYFYEDKDNRLWIGLHGAGLANYDRNTDAFVFYRNNGTDPNTLSSNIVHCITEDHNGNMWIGTGQNNGGLDKVIRTTPAIRHLIPDEKDKSQNGNLVRCIMEDNNQVRWVATKNGKIHLFRSKESNPFQTINLITTPNSSEQGNNVYAMLQDDRGFIWLGTKGEGIGISKNPVTQGTSYNQLSFEWFKHNDNDSTSLPSNNIYDIIQLSPGRFCIGTFGNGISLASRRMGGKMEFVNINTANSNLSSNLVRSILLAHDNQLWIATAFGINCIDIKSLDQAQFQFRTFFHSPDTPESLSYNDVVHIFEDNEQHLWFTTYGGGANRLNYKKDQPIRFIHYSSDQGLGNDIVMGILQDNNGYIWLSTENGISKIDLRNNQMELYNANNKLFFNSFSENTCLKTHNGTLLFGGSNGLVAIHPEMEQLQKATYRIELTNLFIANKEITVHSPNSPLKQNISYTDVLELNHHQNAFSIQFSSLGYEDNMVMKYAYKLDNFESDWNEVGNQNRAVYTNLPPGRYTFRVKASSGAGIWDTNERVLSIRILPPWYRTWWAYLMFLTILVIATYWVHRTLTQLNLYRHDLLLEKKVNQMKLQFFTNISHEIRTPLTLIIGPLEDIINKSNLPDAVGKQLRVIRKNARRMLMLTNQLLDFRKIQNNKMTLQVSEIDIKRFALDIFNSFEPLAAHKNIHYSFECNTDDPKVWADVSRLDIIIYNLLSNALKFTDSGKTVTLRIDETPDAVNIAVIDHGRGIAPELLPEIFTRYTILSTNDLSGTGIGLSLSYELAKLHGGTIEVTSEPGQGSTFTLCLKKGNQHLTNQPEITIIHDAIHQPHPLTIPDNEIVDTTNPLDEPQIRTALVVEDNPEILDYICQSLRPEFNCIKAVNGQEALPLARQYNPSIIITDVMMPVMDGIEMTRTLKESIETSHLPVVMLTAKNDVADQIQGVETGAEAYITKPFNVEYLKSVALNLVIQREKIAGYLKKHKAIEPGNLNISSKDENFLNHLIEFINQNYANDINIDQMAAHCCLSRTVFYNKVKSLTNLSPIEFLRQMKLKIAAQLLEKGYNVSEVAFRVGYNDVKYFSRQFKSFYGYTPSKHPTSGSSPSDED